ncbi:MAG: D-sedoheptulose 7-phosphate isomerase [Candidatus Margulisiibacteriota bacterium]
MQGSIQAEISQNIELNKKVLETLPPKIEAAVAALVNALKAGNKLLICGNGGSAADSQHIAAEFIGRFLKERKPLPAIALSTNTSILTCLGNDYGFDIIFARQVEGLGQKGDVLLGISTSGNSENVVKAFQKARSMGIKTIALTGRGGGKMAKEADIIIIVPSDKTPKIQEAHLMIYHIICQLVESEMCK